MIRVILNRATESEIETASKWIGLTEKEFFLYNLPEKFSINSEDIVIVFDKTIVTDIKQSHPNIKIIELLPLHSISNKLENRERRERVRQKLLELKRTTEFYINFEGEGFSIKSGGDFTPEEVDQLHQIKNLFGVEKIKIIRR